MNKVDKTMKCGPTEDKKQFKILILGSTYPSNGNYILLWATKIGYHI